MLLQQLLANALQQAEKSGEPVGFTSRLHIARVLNVYDKRQAKALFLRAAQELETSSLSRHELRVVQHGARMLAAGIDPGMLPDLPLLDQEQFLHSDFQLFRTMLDHGHVNAAVDYLLKLDFAREFPYMAVPMLLPRCADDEVRLRLLRRATQSWQHTLSKPALSNRRLVPGFLDMFVGTWKILPETEALTLLRQLVSTTLNEEDFTMRAQVDREGGLVFTSSRQHRLFQMLEALRDLDPALTSSLMDGHPELANAAAVFPFGMQSVRKTYAKTSLGQGPSRGGGYIGSGTDRAFFKALVDGRATGQFDFACNEALQTSADDRASNGALKEAWPSTQSLRTLFHAIGSSMGSSGATYLERIRDPDLRLYCEIEFAAAMAGLPAYSGMSLVSPRSTREH